MMPLQAFALLEIQPGSTPAEIRKAWRTKSTIHHPDAGGTNEAMVVLNEALETALSWKTTDASEIAGNPIPMPQASVAFRARRDVSAFTVGVLPVDCWMALEVVAAMCGPTIHEDPPYVMEFLLLDSSLPNSRNGWCRCECVPEAGATTVHLTVGSSHVAEVPNIDDVRDFLVDQLNSIDWPD